MALSMNRTACNANKKGGLFSRPRLRGKDLNLRPLGYEPNELPLLHPAMMVFIICRIEGSSTAQKLHRNRWRCRYGQTTEDFKGCEVGNYRERDCRWGCTDPIDSRHQE